MLIQGDGCNEPAPTMYSPNDGTYVTCTGKSFSEALIHAPTNPQYDEVCLLNYEFST